MFWMERDEPKFDEKVWFKVTPRTPRERKGSLLKVYKKTEKPFVYKKLPFLMREGNMEVVRKAD